MMDKLLAQVARLAAERVTRLADTLAEAAREELPADVSVTREGDSLRIQGMALARRALSEAALRGLTALARTMLK